MLSTTLTFTLWAAAWHWYRGDFETSASLAAAAWHQGVLPCTSPALSDACRAA
jgi:hypothetical protein